MSVKEERHLSNAPLLIKPSTLLLDHELDVSKLLRPASVAVSCMRVGMLRPGAPETTLVIGSQFDLAGSEEREAVVITLDVVLQSETAEKRAAERVSDAQIRGSIRPTEGAILPQSREQTGRRPWVPRCPLAPNAW